MVVKFFEYRRTRWLGEDQTLEQLARVAWDFFPTHTERSVQRMDGVSITGMRRRDAEHLGFAIQCAKYVDRQGVGTIPMRPAAEVDLGEREPGPDENFLNSGFVALIRGNHVICMDCGRNAAAVRYFLAELFRKADFPAATQQFDLVRVGNPNKLALIESQGVKSIELKVGIAEASAQEIINEDRHYGVFDKMKRAAGDVLNSIIQRDDDLAQLKQSQRGTVSIQIDIKSGDLEVAKDGLMHLAKDIAEDEDADEYSIVLRDGKTKITPTEISVKKQVRIQASANYVSIEGAWDQMFLYMSELEESGQLEA